jgi:hypothetical protein
MDIALRELEQVIRTYDLSPFTTQFAKMFCGEIKIYRNIDRFSSQFNNPNEISTSSPTLVAANIDGAGNVDGISVGGTFCLYQNASDLPLRTPGLWRFVVVWCNNDLFEALETSVVHKKSQSY